MKEMTCRQLGGPCDTRHEGATADDVIKAQDRHLREVAASEILGNQSFMFKRTEHSWHAVRPITCPPGRLRKVFIVVVNRVNFQVLWRRVRGKDPDGYPL